MIRAYLPISITSFLTKTIHHRIEKSKEVGKWYIGSTKDLRKRILKHNSGKNKSTKYGIPWKIIYYEASLNKEDARAREKYSKSRNG